MSFAAPLPKESKPRGRLRLPGRFTWPLAFLALAIAAFIFYYLLTMGYLDPSVRDFAQKWMPLGSINEALVWVMAALGLNIVVGYAGLLDLGFVAFWAIGGYCAGWLMSGFLRGGLQGNVKNLGKPAQIVSGGGHTKFLLGLIARARRLAVFGL